MEPFSYVCSLGTRCHTAEFFKENGLKKCSFPFDWIFADPWIVKSCLEDDFEAFLDTSQYIPNKEGTHGTHAKYGNIFIHHNLLDPATQAYFQRCVARFRTLLASPKRKLFFLFAINAEKEPVNDAEIQAIYELLSKKTTNFCLLFLRHHIRYMYDIEIDMDTDLWKGYVHTKSVSYGKIFRYKLCSVFFKNAILSQCKFRIEDDIH